MLKYLYTFLGGALSMAVCVVASNSKPGWMFLLGGILGSVVMFFVLSPHWSSGDGGASRRRNRTIRVGAVAVGAELAPRLQNKTSWGRRGWRHARSAWEWIRQILGNALFQPNPEYGRKAILAGSNPAPQPHSRERLRTATHEQTARRAPTTKKRCTQLQKTVQSPMLRPIQQDILSALTNLRAPYKEAFQCALATKAVSFDEAFREALASVNAGMGKTRRAAA